MVLIKRTIVVVKGLGSSLLFNFFFFVVGTIRRTFAPLFLLFLPLLLCVTLLRGAAAIYLIDRFLQLRLFIVVCASLLLILMVMVLFFFLIDKLKLLCYYPCTFVFPDNHITVFRLITTVKKICLLLVVDVVVLS